ncbi:30270_t:CDS:2 [Gigaspora margarita]|uniref:30270_t:CDS:1 n=1 Tax=Gigaspora margarita TaxID=4874 RepID=A0ABN7UER5_GIGMA|nr:30270_t:CDS:2 [Gigaspora margarita]
MDQYHRQEKLTPARTNVLTPSKNGVDNKTKEKEERKQEKSIKSGPEIALVNLLDSYLEVLDTWISELEIPKELESQSEDKTVGTLKTYEPHKEFTKINPKDDKMRNLGIRTKKEETFDTSNVLGFEDECKALIHYQRPTDDNENSKTIVDTESNDNAPGEEGYQKGNETIEEVQEKSVGIDDKSNKRTTGEKSGVLLEGETLRNACESWLRKVEEFQNSDKWNEESKPRELTGIEQEKIGPDELIDQELANTNESDEKSPRMLEEKNNRMQENYLQENRNPPILTNMSATNSNLRSRRKARAKGRVRYDNQIIPNLLLHNAASNGHRSEPI